MDGQTIGRDIVVAASLYAISFDRGCEAALACYRAISVAWTGEVVIPNPGGPFSMPVWKASIRAFQALMSVRQLLREVEAFEVYVEGVDGCRLQVAASALDRTLPLWSRALETFDVMPTVTFLPANFVSRRAVSTTVEN